MENNRILKLPPQHVNIHLRKNVQKTLSLGDDFNQLSMSKKELLWPIPSKKFYLNIQINR